MADAAAVRGVSRCRAIPPLLGHGVGVTGDRRVEELTVHLRTLGATVLHGPVLHTTPITENLGRLRAVTEAMIARPPEYLLAVTAIGVRGWINAAATWGMQPGLTEALARTRILARGPKVVGALSEGGLPVWFAAPDGRSATMIEHLDRQPLAGARVAVQLPGADMADVVRHLERAGADVSVVAVYDWTWPDDLGPARRLLRALADRRLSAVTFTSRPAVRNFVALARDDGTVDEIVAALSGPVVPVCIGPATSDELRASTGAEPHQPERAILGKMVQVLTDSVRRCGHHHVRTALGEEVVVQRRLVAARDVRVTTSDREAAVLDCLVAARGHPVGRHTLMRSAWRGEQLDPSVIETAMARLRRRLSVTGLGVTTVNGRGYLLDGDVVPCDHQLAVSSLT